MAMNVFVVGAGAREHALIWKLKQSREVEKIYCSPGNGGISHLATLIPACAENDWNSYVDFVQSRQVELTLIGPEVPLAGGVVDHFRKKGLKIFGPDANSARLEASKVYAKEFMKKYGIPTANYRKFDQYSEAFSFISSLPGPYRFPLVVKADGLAAGKGVSLCANFEEAKAAVEKMMVQNVFGPAGATVLVEEKLEGTELSLMAFCDGKTIRTLPPARDYKRINDHDQGPNTGGMGSIAPTPVRDVVLEQIDREIVRPFLKGIRAENLDYRGIIYFGLMLTKSGPSVLEFNVRFGDPETQVVLPLVRSDLLQLFNAVVDQSLDKVRLEIDNKVCMSVVCASSGYPEKFQSHKEISGVDGLDADNGLFLFHAGTVKENDRYFTSGGRVLNVVAKADRLDECRTKCYNTLSKIGFEGMHYRRDIGDG